VAKKVQAVVRLQIPAGQATPAPPVGPALGQHGVNIMSFVKEYNERTNKLAGSVVPVVITIFADRSFAFETKSPPASDLLKKAAKLEKGSPMPGAQMSGSVSKAQIREIAQTKMSDLNSSSVETAMHLIEGTARSMGITVTE